MLKIRLSLLPRTCFLYYYLKDRSILEYQNISVQVRWSRKKGQVFFWTCAKNRSPIIVCLSVYLFVCLFSVSPSACCFFFCLLVFLFGCTVFTQIDSLVFHDLKGGKWSEWTKSHLLQKLSFVQFQVNGAQNGPKMRILLLINKKFSINFRMKLSH